MKATIHFALVADDCLFDEKTIMYVKKEVELPEENRLEYIQDIVGGLIDIYHHNETGRDWVLNDEGMLLDLPPNPFADKHGLMLCGNIIEVHGRLP